MVSSPSSLSTIPKSTNIEIATLNGHSKSYPERKGLDVKKREMLSNSVVYGNNIKNILMIM